MEPLRILLVLTTSTGGVGTHVASLAERYAAAGHTVGIIGAPETDAHFGFTRGARGRIKFVPVEFRSSLGLRDTATVRRLSWLVSTFRADVVHAHGFRAGLAVLSAIARIAPAERPASVVSWHNRAMATGARGLAEKAVETLVARGADLTIGASEDLVDEARAFGARNAVFAPVAAPRAQTNDDVNAALLRSRLTRELDLPRDAQILLSVGRVAPQKNYRMLLEALAELAPDHPRLHALIAGSADPVELERIAAYARPRRLPVHMLGQRSDVGDLLRAADLFVLTSEWEARALVVQEAMAAGTPIVATAVGGLPGLLGDAGVLVPRGDSAALAAGLRRLLDDPDERVSLGSRAALRSRDLPDEDAVAQTLLAHYRDVLAGRRTDRGTPPSSSQGASSPPDRARPWRRVMLTRHVRPQ
ncbi:glycosyltransferase family 4 protein [Brevibacterium samyangense]|uniref:D-inositol 3-phosphate glycosyltransferase n=1 Tax=Brevibacterium samyangense TaxID=366888 RepID=A0ABN2TCN0_9MICO